MERLLTFIDHKYRGGNHGSDDTVVAAFDAFEDALGGSFRALFRSITSDRGSEFADYKGMEALFLRRKAKADCRVLCPRWQSMGAGHH
jgi:IS30 family transposase